MTFPRSLLTAALAVVASANQLAGQQVAGPRMAERQTAERQAAEQELAEQQLAHRQVANRSLANQRLVGLGGVVASHEQDLAIDERIADTDGDGRQELLLLCRAARTAPAALVRVAFDPTDGALRLDGIVAIDDPAHTLIALADLLPAAGEEVVVADPSGIACRGFGAPGAAEPPPRVVLARAAKFRVRVDQPQFSPFVMDLNEDGRLDLMLPTLLGVQPFLQEAGDDDTPAFRRMAMVLVPVAVDVDPGSRGLDQELTGSLRIPQIQTEDLDGDGRPDLLTRDGQVHAFHLQTEDGNFAPPIEVDIGQFEDSTPKAAMELGSTVVLGDRQLLQRGDIDGDGVPDYVIAHRRKIWTFIAGRGGPQFEQARTQAVADDVTAMLVVDVDEDERADLLTFRVQLPGIGALLLGLVRSIDIDVKAVGYQSEADGFARTPKWRRTVTLRIPPLLSLLSRQDELIERFTELIGKTRITARGRFRGDDAVDLAMVLPDRTRIELLADVGDAPTFTSLEGRRMMRRLLFEDEDTVFDLERMFGLVSGFLDSMAERVVGDRQAVATLPLRSPELWNLRELLVGEFDGRPGEELVAVYDVVGDEGRRAYDLLSWRE